jgi:hypothetical protein
MKLYLKNEEIVVKPKMVKLNDKYYINPSDEILIKAGYVIEDYENTFNDVLSEKIKQIEEYNVSENVDIFYVNNIPMWLNRELRNSLMSRFNAEKANSIEVTNIWYNGMNITLPVETAINMLLTLEIYASKCFDNTHKHLYNVNQLKTIEEINSYDHTLNYPEHLHFNI